MEFAESLATSLWKNAENECLTTIKGIANVLIDIISQEKQDGYIHFYIQLIVLLHIHSPQVKSAPSLTLLECQYILSLILQIEKSDIC